MAVLHMQRIRICALKNDRKPILDTLQRRGVIEITNEVPQDDVFTKTDTSQSRIQFERHAAAAASALEVLANFAPVKTSLLDSLSGREPITLEQYESSVERRDEVQEVAYQLVALSKKVAENNAEILRIEAQLDALRPWMSLDLSLQFTGTRHTAAFIGSLPDGELALSDIYTQFAEYAPEVDAVDIEVISQSKDQTCIMATVLKQDSDKAQDALRAMGFIRPSSPPEESPPERDRLLRERITAIEAETETVRAEIVSYASRRDELKFMADYYTMRADKYAVLGDLVQSKRTFFITGYIPANAVPTIRADLESRYNVEILVTDPDPDDEDVPVVIKNNFFSEPVESVIASYGMPGKTDVDPTVFVSLFYYVLFGLMYSDFGYGLIVTLACGFVMLKVKNMEDGFRKSVRMFFFCGISTMFWGAMFGTFFGDLITSFSSTFLSNPVLVKPLWFDPLGDPMRLLTFSMGLGVIHLFCALGVAGYQFLRQKKIVDFITQVVVIYLFVGGSIVFGLSTDILSDILGVDKLSPSVGNIAMWIMLVGLAGIIFGHTDGPKNPILRILLGLYDVYNVVTGWLSDILSYSRLLALGLATGVVGSVVNQMGTLGGSGVFGLCLFVLVFIIGHALNFAIEILGAYVHTNRLQYVEAFGKFYDGSGRAMEPFKANTKYYRIKEEHS